MVLGVPAKLIGCTPLISRCSTSQGGFHPPNPIRCREFPIFSPAALAIKTQCGRCQSRDATSSSVPLPSLCQPVGTMQSKRGFLGDLSATTSCGDAKGLRLAQGRLPAEGGIDGLDSSYWACSQRDPGDSAGSPKRKTPPNPGLDSCEEPRNEAAPQKLVTHGDFVGWAVPTASTW